MSLDVYQLIMARLATEPLFLADFEQDRLRTLDNFKLDEKYQAALLELDQTQLRIFSASLINKRWGVVADLLHLDADERKLLHPHFKHGFADHHTIKGGPVKHQNDAVRFLTHLRTRKIKLDRKLKRRLRKQEEALKAYLTRV